MDISVIGLGYIGLPTALLFAKSGHNVAGVDISGDVVRSLNEGRLHFEETGLDELFSEASGKFSAREDLLSSDVYIIAVPTPLDKEMKLADLKAVKSAAESVSSVLKEGQTVIIESTIPPGTSHNFIKPILDRSGAGKYFFSHCPERAIPGKTIEEMVENDRIVGGIDDDSTRFTVELYRSFVRGRMFETDITTAEFVKLMENTYRDINIALANEFALIGEELGIDIWKAIDLANKHPRVNIHSPGPGVGGHCIAIDPWFMVEKSSHSKIVNLAREINTFMPIHVMKLVKDIIDGYRIKKITIFGVSYKGNVDDTRESPAFKVARIAESEGIEVSFYDPLAGYGDLDGAVEDTDCIVLITDHDLFRDVDPRKLLVRHKNMVDSRNILDHQRWIEAGFRVNVLGIGR
ncbi:MAG: nucleotide sugar dehydrogenase [Thermoplasmatota archaeon]